MEQESSAPMHSKDFVNDLERYIKKLESKISTLEEENKELKNTIEGYTKTHEFTCRVCGTHEKEWSVKNDDWYCKTCRHLIR